MKKIIKSSVVAGLLFGTALIADGFTLKSDDMFGQMSTSQVFNGFGCTGKNISPQLTWSHAPKGTKSFAVTMYDPDAPTGSGWWHWLVFNISQETQGLEVGVSGQDKMPKGAVESKTDYGTFAFGGACPPQGDNAHTYITTVYALDVEKLDLDKNANPALVGYMINAHTIEKSSIVTHYSR